MDVKEIGWQRVFASTSAKAFKLQEEYDREGLMLASFDSVVNQLIKEHYDNKRQFEVLSNYIKSLESQLKEKQ